jgi:hypothetical protein
LDQDVAAGFIDALATAKAVLSHACHHHGEHVWTVNLCDGTEQNVDRRAT